MVARLVISIGKQAGREGRSCAYLERFRILIARAFWRVLVVNVLLDMLAVTAVGPGRSSRAHDDTNSPRAQRGAILVWFGGCVGGSLLVLRGRIAIGRELLGHAVIGVYGTCQVWTVFFFLVMPRLRS